MRVLITGGAGYIGSHTLGENLSNGHEEALSRVKQLANKDFGFVEGDIRDRDALDRRFPSSSLKPLSILLALRPLVRALRSRSPIMRIMSPVQ